VKIAVCVKQVPDTNAEKRLTPDWRLDRAGAEQVLNPFDEYAVEEAVRIKERLGGQITALSMGPEPAKEAIRRAIAMGCDQGVLVSDPALAGSDALATALVLSKALAKLGFDLVLCGQESTDARGGLVPSQLAEHLDVPQHGYVAKLEFADGTVTSHRQVPGGYAVVQSRLPAVVSVVKAINEPRYPTLPRIMQAKRAQIAVWSLADLGVAPAAVGAAGARTRVLGATPAKPRGAAQIHVDKGDAAAVIADFLAERRLI